MQSDDDTFTAHSNNHPSTLFTCYNYCPTAHLRPLIETHFTDTPYTMSRHKIVKNLDLDDELDDYDGGNDYAEDGTEGMKEL